MINKVKTVIKTQLSGILLTIFVFLVLFLISIWRLTEAPPNVTGDEITYLNDVLYIIYSPDLVNPFSLMGYNLVSGINFYVLALFVKAFPDQHAILGMRIASAVFGLGVLIVFYLYIRAKFTRASSLLATFLLGTNYVFLNFSRSSWFGSGHGWGLICGFISFLFIERAVHEKKWFWAAFGGAFGGLGLYGYTGTTVFIFAVPVFFLYLFIRKQISFNQTLKKLTIFFVFAILISLPHILTILNHYEQYSNRPRATSIRYTPVQYYTEKGVPDILKYQTSQIVRGFLLLDPSVNRQGNESPRYGPRDAGLVDTITRILFFTGLVVLFFHRKSLVLPTMAFLAALGIQMVTVFPPDFSRGIFVLFFVYLVVLIGLDKLWISFPKTYARMALVLFIVMIGVWNVHYYFEWNTSQQLAEARQPAIAYEQVKLWVTIEKQLIADRKGHMAITNLEWQEISKNASNIR